MPPWVWWGNLHPTSSSWSCLFFSVSREGPRDTEQEETWEGETTTGESRGYGRGWSVARPGIMLPGIEGCCQQNQTTTWSRLLSTHTILMEQLVPYFILLEDL